MEIQFRKVPFRCGDKATWIISFESRLCRDINSKIWIGCFYKIYIFSEIEDIKHCTDKYSSIQRLGKVFLFDQIVEEKPNFENTYCSSSNIIDTVGTSHKTKI